MKVSIKLCKHCPLKDGCEYKKNLFVQTRTILPNITMVHNCPEYKKVFKEMDEVEVQLLVPRVGLERTNWVKDVVARGVVYYAPNTSRQKHYGVAFFEPQNFYKVNYPNIDTEKKSTFGFKANQLKKVGEYKGTAFWETDEYPTF